MTRCMTSTSEFRTSHVLLSLYDMWRNEVVDDRYQPSGRRVIVHADVLLPVTTIQISDLSEERVYITVGDLDLQVTPYDKLFFIVYKQ